MTPTLAQRVYAPSPSNKVTAGEFHYRGLEHGLNLSDEELDQVHDYVMTRQCNLEPIMGEATLEALNQAIDAGLAWLGFLDGPGDCPVCHRNGWVRTKKHESCVNTLFAQSNHHCDFCKKNRATTIYGWRPFCLSCADHQEHLDILYD